MLGLPGVTSLGGSSWQSASEAVVGGHVEDEVGKRSSDQLRKSGISSSKARRS
jgi:hypothetical protein